MALARIGQISQEQVPTMGSRTVDYFEKLELLGEGTYGQVFMARETKTGEIVAMKKIRMDNEKEGFPITSIREIKLLKQLNHTNIIKLKEIVTNYGHERENQGGNKFNHGIYMVFEYMEHDLAGLAGRPGLRFSDPQIKCYMQQLLSGLHYCHLNNVLHRDIKGSNLLLNNEGTLKLADFGLATSFSYKKPGNLTNRVITLWYRPPELLLGSTMYGPAVDMWSAGCILGELLHGKPILNGKNEADQLKMIFELCGSPDELNWPDVSKTPLYNHFKPPKPLKRRVREKFEYFDCHALDLLDNLLSLNPNQRLTALQALDSEYFWSGPKPSDPKSLPKYEPMNVYQSKKRKREREEARQVTGPPSWLLQLSQQMASQGGFGWARPNHGGRPESGSQARPHGGGPYPPQGHGFPNNGYFVGRGTRYRGSSGPRGRGRK